MTFIEAVKTIRKGKKVDTPQETLTEAAKVINAKLNARRIRRLLGIGYSEEEAKALVYTAP